LAPNGFEAGFQQRPIQSIRIIKVDSVPTMRRQRTPITIEII
jgi:hypothetical protein